jgi:hypothetical protein
LRAAPARCPQPIVTRHPARADRSALSTLTTVSADDVTEATPSVLTGGGAFTMTRAANTDYGSADRTRRGCRPSTYPTNGG